MYWTTRLAVKLGLGSPCFSGKGAFIRFFIERMDEDNADFAVRASTELVNRYSEYLSTQQLAKAVLISGGDTLHPFGNQKWLRRFESDPDFQNDYPKRGRRCVKWAARSPCLRVADALTNNAKWADIVWRLLLKGDIQELPKLKKLAMAARTGSKSDSARASIGAATTAFLTILG